MLYRKFKSFNPLPKLSFPVFTSHLILSSSYFPGHSVSWKINSVRKILMVKIRKFSLTKLNSSFTVSLCHQAEMAHKSLLPFLIMSLFLPFQGSAVELTVTGPSGDQNRDSDVYKTSSATNLRPGSGRGHPSGGMASTLPAALRGSDPTLGFHQRGTSSTNRQHHLSPGLSTSNLSERSALSRQRRGSTDWSDFYGNRMKHAVSNDSLLAHHSALSEGLVSNFTTSHHSLLASDGEEAVGHADIASKKAPRSRPLSGRTGANKVCVAMVSHFVCIAMVTHSVCVCHGYPTCLL